MNIWDISTGALALRCDGCHGQQEVTLVTLDASGKHFITGSRGGDVKVHHELCSPPDIKK